MRVTIVAMERAKGCFVLLVFIVLACACAGAVELSNIQKLDNLRDYDDEFEMLDSVKPEIDSAVVQHDGDSFSNGPDIVEMTTAQCSTLDRTRTCDCGFVNQDLTVPIYSGNMLQMIIRNCKRVIVRANTFANIYNIAHLAFENIEDLVLHSNALSFPIADWGHVNIRLQNVRTDFIPEHTFNGFIQSIFITSCNIGALERFSANGIRSTVDRLRIEDTTITMCEPYAFKKFTVNTIEIYNITTIGAIPSKFFYGLEVRNRFSISNCSLSIVQPSAFDMNDVDSFHLTGNYIQVLNGEAFRMSLLNGVTIQNNRVDICHPSAFRSMTITNNYWRHHNTPMPFGLSSTTISTMDLIAPLVISEQFQSLIVDLRYLNRLTCDDVKLLTETAFFVTNKDSILFRMQDKLLDSDQTDEQEFNTISHITNHLCISRSLFWYYVLIGGTIVLILLLLILILLCVWYRRRKAQQMSLIVPDGRTYKETTIVMQIENHGLLKTDL